MINKVEESLQKIFQDHRVVFWYDARQEFRAQYESLHLAEVECLEVVNTEFYIKYRITREKPADKFLLYFAYEPPAQAENWLLDQELAHYVFHTDQEALFLQELGLEYHFKELVHEHLDFFKSQERRNKLKDLLGEGDQHQELRYKMLAVLFDTDHTSLVSYLQSHAAAFQKEDDGPDKELERYRLADFYWKEVARKFNYHSDSPGIYDFLLEVFSHNFSLGQRSGISRDANIFLSLWKDALSHQETFRTISEKIAQDLQVEQLLNEAELSGILGEDLFRLVDIRIISELVSLLSQEEISHDRIEQFVKQRENKYWYPDFGAFYACISYASELLNLVRKYETLSFQSFEEGAGSYATELFRIDFAYRKFILNLRKTNHNKVLAQLENKVEKVYTNDWLLGFNNRWQAVVEKLGAWPSGGRQGQAQFFQQNVQPILDKGQRVFVIISDALRYECGWEFGQRIIGEDRYQGQTDYLVASLPSYTQLGMASLLPHKELEIAKSSSTVLVDGIPSLGISGRTKILEQNVGPRAGAILAEDFMRFKSHTTGREYVKQHDLIYIYHNQIDKAGDDTTSEDKVFEAVEKELDLLMDLVKKIANMNGTQMFITSDHGFLYQHRPLEESDFLSTAVSGELWKESRRFILGTGLEGNSSLQHFSASQLNLAEPVEALIPKSINRLRIKGAGSRFVHGGMTLPEVLVPVVRITKTRQSTISQVEIDLIKSTDKITTNILAVSFIQSDLITSQIQPRQIRAAIFAEDGELLSDSFTYLFDIEEGSERLREVKYRFQLSSKASGKYKNQRVKLVLEEPLEDANKWRVYKTYFYTLNISFTNDFDDY